MYRTESHIAKALFDTAVEPPTDEYFFRELAHNLVGDIPLEELKKMFRFIKIDPFSEKYRDRMNDPSVPDSFKDMLINLRRMGVIQYEAQTKL